MFYLKNAQNLVKRVYAKFSFGTRAALSTEVERVPDFKIFAHDNFKIVPPHT